LQVFFTKFVAKNFLYKIFCKKIGSNILQIFFQKKIYKYFLQKKIKIKLAKNMIFFNNLRINLTLIIRGYYKNIISRTIWGFFFQIYGLNKVQNLFLKNIINRCEIFKGGWIFNDVCGKEVKLNCVICLFRKLAFYSTIKKLLVLDKKRKKMVKKVSRVLFCW